MPYVFSKYFFLLLMLAVSDLKAQETVSPAEIDSISWQQYQNGDWDSLIRTGKLAAKNNIAFKWLHQRMGYAHFVKGEYYKSKFYYKKALTYDETDEISRLYLYYTNLYTGHILAARLHAGFLPDSLLYSIDYKKRKLLNSVDVEYSYKRPDEFWRENEIRKDAVFRRFGISSLPDNRISLYQSLAGFSQETDLVNTTRQLEYFGLLSAQLSPSLLLQGGYRYTGTRYTVLPDTFYQPGHAFLGKLNYQAGRFDAAMSMLHYNNGVVKLNQWGVELGAGFSGIVPLYLKSSVYYLNEKGISDGNDYSHFIFQQDLGVMIIKNKLWAEVLAAVGDQNMFHSADGLYFYNARDPVVGKTGASLTTYISHNLSLTVHYGREKKYIPDYQEYYYQQALTGGIQWIF